ncbi:hypothetical protein RhiirC2_846555 [Rhizophagus irregularis]|uniref:F-box domain-containing protein n=1 Tax=Rhizophagus irregularis TaxID=588596 RepID=A0A2N1NLJ7_9GLOM|nr:hypothetical protein RhiirC2_846555 [Rhizophagus irregularis]
MSKLYGDILYLIFEELQYDKKSLVLCLRVNKAWCEIIVPILWKNPWERLTHGKKKSLLNVIISYLSDETKNNLINYFTNPYKKPSFNYFSFCKHLNLEVIKKIIKKLTPHSNFKEIKNDILNLFINENMDYTHLYIPKKFDYHFNPGAESCISEIKFLKCNDRINDNILSILTKTCKSIKELELTLYEYNYNCGIAKLIENQNRLSSISFLNDFIGDNPSRMTIENSLIKHADTIQYFGIREQLETKVFTSFVNLKMLELMGKRTDGESKWNNIKDLSLLSLQSLKASNIPINCLANLILSSGKQLTKICYYNYYNDVVSNKILIQAIYHNCPNLIYLELLYRNENILDLEKLLINCQYLKRIDFNIYYYKESLFHVSFYSYVKWDNLFNILAKSSPSSLFEFVFKYTDENPELESLKLFFDNWESRFPISLKFKKERDYYYESGYDDLVDLIEIYKEKGVIKNFVHYHYDEDSDLLEIYKTKRVINNPESVIKNSEIKSTSIWNRFKKKFNKYPW